MEGISMKNSKISKIQIIQYPCKYYRFCQSKEKVRISMAKLAEEIKQPGKRQYNIKANARLDILDRQNYRETMSTIPNTAANCKIFRNI